MPHALIPLQKSQGSHHLAHAQDLRYAALFHIYAELEPSKQQHNSIDNVPTRFEVCIFGQEKSLTQNPNHEFHGKDERKNWVEDVHDEVWNQRILVQRPVRRFDDEKKAAY